MEHPFIFIGKKKIGSGNPVFIIAEAGVNHNGNLTLAKKLIDAAAKAGADAVKFQTFNPDTLATKGAEKAEYQKKNGKKHHPTSILPSTEWRRREGGRRGGESQYEMLKRLMLPREVHSKLKRYAEKRGLIFLSTPFSLDDALFLKKLGVPALKIASSDTNNLPFLSKLAEWKLPVILSTGMADLEEVREAVQTIQNPSSDKNRSAPFRKGRIRRAPLILLHCTTSYPTLFSEVNLLAIETMRKEFGLLVGFSDHTWGSEAAIAAVALGSVVIEKHFTLNRRLQGPDHKASLMPAELRDFVRNIRNIETALGTGKKIPSASEKENAKVSRKSIVAARDVKKGERFTENNLAIKRPGTGFPPKYFNEIIGSRAARDIKVDTLITKHDYAT